MNSQEAKESLIYQNWREGRIFVVTEGPYRYRVMVHCSASGRQKAMFANGEHPYFCYMELLSGNGQWIERGNGVTPVLPSGQILMVVEQRPAHGHISTRPSILRVGGKEIDLAKFGSYSSLELPGGATNPGESVKIGALRELIEECGIKGKYVELWHCLRPLDLFGSDIAIKHHSNVVYLPDAHYEKWTVSDGGLNVLALTEEEIWENFHRGVITSGQAFWATWNFYQEVCRVRQDSDFLQHLKFIGYLLVETVSITN